MEAITLFSLTSLVSPYHSYLDQSIFRGSDLQTKINLSGRVNFWNTPCNIDFNPWPEQFQSQHFRGNRAGVRKQRPIKTITSRRPTPSFGPTRCFRQANPKNLITIKTVLNVPITDLDATCHDGVSLVPTTCTQFQVNTTGHRPSIVTRIANDIPYNEQPVNSEPSSMSVHSKSHTIIDQLLIPFNDQPANGNSTTSLADAKADCNNRSHRSSENSPPNRTKTTTKSSQLKCALLNARSVNNKTALIYEYIVSCDLDALFITETWLKGDSVTILNQMIPAGYTKIKNDRSNGQIGGGIIVIHKIELPFKENFSVSSTSSFESLVCTLSLNNVNFIFAVVYRPSPSPENGLSYSAFYDEIQDFLLEVSTDSNKVVILGDFNIHVNDPTDQVATNFMNMLKSFNLIQRVDKPTHQLGNTLDLVITDQNEQRILNVEVENSHISDHYSVNFDIDLRKPRRPERTVKFRKTRSIDVQKFKIDLKNTLDARVMDGLDVEESVNLIDNSLTSVLDDHAPVKEKRITLRPDSKWFTDSIKDMKKKRRQAEHRWRKSGLDIDKRNYMQLRNQTNSAISEAKQAYIRNSIENCNGSSKEIFRIVNGLIRPDKSLNLPTRSDSSNDTDIANEFGHFFIDKIENLRGSLDASQNQACNPLSAMPTPSAKLSFFRPTTPSEIRKLIEISPNKTCDLDAIPTWLLKECADELAYPLTSMINASFNSGRMPQKYKCAHVFPLIKKISLDKEQLKNYRPVSNLNFVSKIMEKIVSIRLHEHLSSGNLETDFQSAYKKEHSTETALLRVYNDIVASLTAKNNVALLMLDLSSAFDTIDHNILSQRLAHKFGITGCALEWIENYLQHRTMHVVINGSSSNAFDIKYGVPQGSVLGPILFTLYTSDLVSVIQKHKMEYHMYADDSQLYLCFDEPSAIASRLSMEKCVSDIRKWMISNKLKLNDDKTELIVFRKPRAELLIDSINVGDTTIQNSQSVKNLGCVFDEFLSLNDHIKKICQTVQYYLRLISQIRHLLDTRSVTLVVHALVTSRIDYCNSLLYGLPKTSLNKIQKLQNRAARLVSCTRRTDHISPVLQTLHWLPVEMRIRFKLACIAFKCIHGSAPTYLKSLVSVRRPARTLRSSSQLLLNEKLCKTVFASRAFAFAVPSVWNSITQNTRECDTFTNFKSKLKTELFRKAYH